jgi:hypothetical protein
MTRGERQGFIDRADSHLSIARQCQLLKVARSTLYYRPAPVSDDDLAVMPASWDARFLWATVEALYAMRDVLTDLS